MTETRRRAGGLRRLLEWWSALLRGHRGEVVADPRLAALAEAVRRHEPGRDAAAPVTLPVATCVLPDMIRLEAGRTYLWCSCGRSASQPFCDGRSHAGTGLVPLPFTVRRSQVYWLCTCKYTRRPPFCDAAHNRLPAFMATWRPPS